MTRWLALFRTGRGEAAAVDPSVLFADVSGLFWHVAGLGMPAVLPGCTGCRTAGCCSGRCFQVPRDEARYGMYHAARWSSGSPVSGVRALRRDGCSPPGQSLLDARAPGSGGASMSSPLHRSGRRCGRCGRHAHLRLAGAPRDRIPGGDRELFLVSSPPRSCCSPCRRSRTRAIGGSLARSGRTGRGSLQAMAYMYSTASCSEVAP